MITCLCGVYSITHRPTGRLYVGQSVDIFKRWREHMRMLLVEHHHAPDLQALWDADGPTAFDFRVLESVDDEAMLDDAEARWLTDLGDHGLLVHRITGQVNYQAVGRFVYGPDNLTWNDIQRIRAEAVDGPTRRRLMQEYGVSRNLMWEILAFKVWVDEPADANATAREMRRSKNGTPDTTPEVVIEVRGLLDAAELSRSSIAAKIGIHPATVYSIASGKTWRWVLNPDGTPWQPRADEATESRGRRRRLSFGQVREIRTAMLAGGESYREIALRYGVTTSSVNLIATGKNWGWLKNEDGSDWVPLDRRNRALSEEEVHTARSMLAQGASQRVVAARFQITQPSVGRLARGETYSWVASRDPAT